MPIREALLVISLAANVFLAGAIAFQNRGNSSNDNRDGAHASISSTRTVDGGSANKRPLQSSINEKSSGPLVRVSARTLGSEIKIDSTGIYFNAGLTDVIGVSGEEYGELQQWTRSFIAELKKVESGAAEVIHQAGGSYLRIHPVKPDILHAIRAGISDRLSFIKSFPAGRCGTGMRHEA